MVSYETEIQDIYEFGEVINYYIMCYNGKKIDSSIFQYFGLLEFFLSFWTKKFTLQRDEMATMAASYWFSSSPATPTMTTINHGRSFIAKEQSLWPSL